jgi:hypothetical protein
MTFLSRVNYNPRIEICNDMANSILRLIENGEGDLARHFLFEDLGLHVLEKVAFVHGQGKASPETVVAIQRGLNIRG